MPACTSCGADNPGGVKFCGECGAALAVPCASCGTPNEPGRKFCGECGTPLGATAPPAAATKPSDPQPVAERRLVSVLFADLVGFTALSESRDPEEVRELLSRYFDSCRRLIELYGGAVEKFIGDAVMAVWGTPVAQEDDAERAVRTALDLVAAVTALGDEVGAPELRARAGVLTGEAAVSLGAVGEGMVAGDLVNTAARIQSAAEPGTVLVGDATRRATEQAVVFEEAGEHTLKGKAEPLPLYRAVRVTAARGGALRSEGLEAPFVGRERELRLVKELFHASAEQSRAQLVQISGIAGIGKSRLAWEFFKYLDGLAEAILWHRGRCLSYGEGVAYWGLAEMVRTRAQILEGEDQATARKKLDACLLEFVPDTEERAWIGPRLGNLLGLEDRADTDRQDLFAAWRLFFERLADASPVVLVFEDLQWADQALLAFVEYLLEWSGSLRLYVLALSRPELAEQHPNFGRAVRNAATLALEPLPDGEMEQLLEGYVPGLQPELQAQILGRAQGIPLYAVETVRMLLDRGLLVQDGPVYRPTGEIESLEVPESLHALAAARLDGLPPEERRLVQDACVLGKTFGKRAIATLTGRPEEELDPLLSALVRKEVLSLQADPRQPERGQYGFLQELLRQVAYDTLPKRERRQRHLAAVAALEQALEGVDEEMPEVIAAHLLAAAEAAPDDPETPAIRDRARTALVLAADRGEALAAPEEARRHLEQAAALAADDASLRAGLLERAGTLAFRAGDTAGARERLEAALALQEEEEGEFRPSTVLALASVDAGEGRLEDATRRLRAVLGRLEQAAPTPELATVLTRLSRVEALSGDLESATPLVEQALQLTEEFALEEELLHALGTKSTLLLFAGRWVEARLLVEGAMARARAAELHERWLNSANNFAVLLEYSDRFAETMTLSDEMVAVARQRGDSQAMATARLGDIPSLVELGRWDDALARAAEAEQLQASPAALSEAIFGVPVLCERGDLEAAAALLAPHEWQREAEHTEFLASFAVTEARLLRSRNSLAEALAAAERGLACRSELGIASRKVKLSLVEALEAALALDDLVKADELITILDELQPGQLTPILAGERARFHARIAARRGATESVEHDFQTAARTFGEHSLVFRHALTLLEHAEWLVEQERPADARPLLDQAREAFEQLRATPWVERVDAIELGSQAEVPA